MKLLFLIVVFFLLSIMSEGTPRSEHLEDEFGSVKTRAKPVASATEKKHEILVKFCAS